MTNAKFIWKITRPEGTLLCFFCAWVMATLSGANDQARLYVALAAGISCLGASIFHYGANSRVYSRKQERVDVNHPRLLKWMGGGCLALSIGLAAGSGSILCTAISMVNAAVIWFYAGMLSKYWISKNLSIAAVCTTPAFMGWWVGSATHPATTLILITIFLTFLSREVIKDVIDIKANCGLRVTLPMVIGVSGALDIAAIQTVMGAVTSLLLWSYLWTAWIASVIMLVVAWQLLVTKEPRQAHRLITFSVSVLMLAFVI